MNDNPLIQLILSVLNGQLAIFGIPGVVIAKSYQDVRNGVELAGPPSAPTVSAYLVKLYDIRDGFPAQVAVWNSDNTVETQTLTQLYHSTFQISTLSVQIPGNTTQLTASDVANIMATILQSPQAQALFQAQGVGMLDIIKNVNNPYFLDDFDRYEASPNFEFTLVHNQILTQSIPYSDTVTVNPLLVP